MLTYNQVDDFTALLLTEEQFVGALTCVKTQYAEPLKQMMASAVATVRVQTSIASPSSAGPAPRILTTVQHRQIFTDALALLRVHDRVLQRWRDLRGVSACVGIAAAVALEEMTASAQVYTSYLGALPGILRTITDVQAQSDVLRAYVVQRRSAGGGRSLMDLVQLPLQRLPVYLRYVERYRSHAVLVVTHLVWLRHETTGPCETVTCVCIACWIFRLLYRVMLAPHTTKETAQSLEVLRSSLQQLVVIADGQGVSKRVALAQHFDQHVANRMPPLPRKHVLPPSTAFVAEYHFIEMEAAARNRASGARESAVADVRDPQYIAVQDVVVVLFREELFLLSSFSYWNTLEAKAAEQLEFSDRLATDSVTVELVTGPRMSPYAHMLRLTSDAQGAMPSKSYLLAASGRTAQLEFYDAMVALVHTLSLAHDR